MTNAFTAKPDLSKFWKQTKRTEHATKLGQRANDNPTTEQRATFHNIIKPKNER